MFTRQFIEWDSWYGIPGLLQHKLYTNNCKKIFFIQTEQNKFYLHVNSILKFYKYEKFVYK